MQEFSLARVPRLVFGAGTSGRLGGLVAELAGGETGVLLVADAGLAALGLSARLAEAIKAAGHRVVAYDRIVSDPREDRVEEAVALARDREVGAVVALGGGSALDAGKLAAAALAAPGELAAYRLAARPLPARRVPLVCVPTTAGTGSETTAVSVVSDAAGTKAWYWADALKPDVAVLDPALTAGLPGPLTAACGLDAIVHAMEAATGRSAFAENSLVCHGAIALAVAHLERAVAAPGDLEARGALLLAAARAGIAIDNCGTGVAHMIAHALASLMPIHHGRAVALAMVASLAWSMEEGDPVWEPVARAFGCAHRGELPMAFCGLVRRLGLSTRLAGDTNRLSPERLAAQMARPENAPMRRASRREVADADLLILAERVLMA